jgi:hypothetical protein
LLVISALGGDNANNGRKTEKATCKEKGTRYKRAPA